MDINDRFELIMLTEWTTEELAHLEGMAKATNHYDSETMLRKFRDAYGFDDLEGHS